MNHPVIARLAAANPVAAPPVVHASAPVRARRRVLVAALAVASITLPGVAFADEVGGLFGFSAQGEPAATTSTPFAQVTALDEALRELDFPATLQFLGRRDGIGFYAARRADGAFCVAVDSGGGKGVACDLGSPSGAIFPSPQRPLIDFSRFSHGVRLAGFAADGVSSVALVDAAGAIVASAPVVDNVYADANPPAGAVAVEARDAHGAVI